MNEAFFQITFLLAITVFVAFILRLLRQPIIIAYLIVGLIAGPMFLNLLHLKKEVFEVFAQFGVVLLLFIIGINLNFRHLKNIARVSFISGIGQFIFTVIFGVLILQSFGFPLLSSFYLAIAMTFSSTIIIMKLLSDKKDTDKVYGKYTIGLMLVQDIIAIIILVILGILKDNNFNQIESIAFLILKAFFIGFTLFLISARLLPKILDKISYSSELLFLFTVAWCLSLATIFQISGFSIELGAIVAGIALSSSPYQLEIASRIKPLRDFFLVIFFIILGSEMYLENLEAILIFGIALSLFILIGNPLILYILFRALKFTRRNSFLAGLTAAQVSEFGFVLLFVARQSNYLDGLELSIFTFVAITTIFVSSYLITYGDKIYNLLLPLFNIFGPDKYRSKEKIPPMYEVWLIGHHRIGSIVAKTLKEKGINFAVIDYNPTIVKSLRSKKIPCYFGDISDIEFLNDIPFSGAKMVISTIPSLEDQKNLISHLKKLNKNIIVIVSAYYLFEREDLYNIGADYVMLPHYIGAKWISEIIKSTPWTKENFKKIAKNEQKENLIERD